jgi:hypothetical protein
MVLLVGEVIIEEAVTENTFVPVKGKLQKIKISREAGSDTVLYPSTSATVGPKSWGILQIIDGGVIGWALAMTLQDGSTVDIQFPYPDPSGLPGSSIGGPDVPIRPVVRIHNGAVYNGLSDEALLSANYVLVGGPQHSTPPAKPGKETGVLLNASIISFTIRLDTGGVNWFPESTIDVPEGLPIVVIGDHSAPSLAVMMEVGPAHIVKLSTDIPA